MADPDFLMRVANLSLLVYEVLLVGLGLWALQGQLPKAVGVKYARRLIFMSQRETILRDSPLHALKRLAASTCKPDRLRYILLFLLGWPDWPPTARVERNFFLWSYLHPHPSSGAASLSFTARIERAHSGRARSASKKDGWLLPILFTS